jgi:hypothetical protein
LGKMIPLCLCVEWCGRGKILMRAPDKNTTESDYQISFAPFSQYPRKCTHKRSFSTQKVISADDGGRFMRPRRIPLRFR